MATIFTRIIEGELPGTFVWRDDLCVGFMSINPLQPGHALVVPVEETDHWLDMNNELSSHVFDVSKRISAAIAAAYQPVKVGLLIAGLEVPHTHIHLVPVFGVNDLDFANQATSVDPVQLEASAERIRAELRAVGESSVANS